MIKCNQSCMYNFGEDGCLKPEWKLCLLSNTVAFDVTDKNVGNKWISVNERMPKILTKVLAINKYGEMMVGTYTEWGWMFPSYFDRITHWMQLPEPPGENDHA